MSDPAPAAAISSRTDTPARAPGSPGQDPVVCVAALRQTLRRRFVAAGIEQAGREASWLLAHLLDWSEAEVLARGDRGLPPALAQLAEDLGARRAGGEPFAYLVGRREFFGRSFAVDARVLVPRPETEGLVATALALPLPDDAKVLDLCTGSGAIAVTLAAERPGFCVVASDLSLAALAVAAANAARLAPSVRLLAADLAAPLDLGRFAAVVGNPPYIPLADASTLPPTVLEFEPALALFGGEDGLAVIDRLLAEAAALAPGAHLLLEVGVGQGELVASRRPDLFTRVAVHPDAAGIARVVVLKRV